MICSECQKEVRKLSLHHDPPRSRKYWKGNQQYFIDKNGEDKPLLATKNKKLCRSCHKKADREWGVRIPKTLKSKRHKKWFLKWRSGHALYK